MLVHLSIDYMGPESADGPVISLSGEVDMLVADEVRVAGDTAIEHALADGRRRVVIDLAEVTFLDSTGIGALVSVSNAARENDVPLVLRSMSTRIAKLLTITGLDGAFVTEP